MGYHVVRGDEHDYEERPYVEGQAVRLATDVTTAAQLGQSRARIWRYRRTHADGDTPSMRRKRCSSSSRAR